MADRLGVIRNAYYKYERGETYPGINTLKRFVNDLGISLDWLFFGIGPKKIVNRTDIEVFQNKIKALENALENERREKEEIREEKEELESDFTENEEIYDQLDKPGICDLLQYVGENPTFYFKLMLYFQEYKAQEETTKKGTRKKKSAKENSPNDKTGESGT